MMQITVSGMFVWNPDYPQNSFRIKICLVIHLYIFKNFSYENDIGHPDSKDYFTGSYPTEICWGKGNGYFGDYNCDSSIALIKSATSFIKAYSKEIEASFILWTG